MYKKLIWGFCVLLGLLLVCVSPYRCMAQAKTIEVQVYSTNIKLLTSIAIECGNFMEGLGSRISCRKVVNQDSISMLNDYIFAAKNSTKNRSVDVRIKIFIINNNGEQIDLCTDGKWSILINGHLVKDDKTFLAFLRSLAGQ